MANDPADDPPVPQPRFADRPAPGVVLIGPDAEVKLQDRRPSFRWHAAAGYEDQLVLVDNEGEFIALVRADGTYVPTDEDDEDVANPDDYEDEEGDGIDRSERTTFDSWYVEKISDDGVDVAAGIAQARLGSALPPGRYGWYVERSVDHRVVMKGERRHITLLGPKLTRLQVRVSSRSHRSSANPGSTSLRITTTPFMRVRIAIARSGRKRVVNYAWGASATGSMSVDWTCKVKGAGRYRWSVTATDAFGKELRRTGTFKAVTQAQCSGYRAAEREAARRRAAARAAASSPPTAPAPAAKPPPSTAASRPTAPPSTASCAACIGRTAARPSSASPRTASSLRCRPLTR